MDRLELIDELQRRHDLLGRAIENRKKFWGSVGMENYVEILRKEPSWQRDEKDQQFYADLLRMLVKEHDGVPQ